MESTVKIFQKEVDRADFEHFLAHKPSYLDVSVVWEL